MVVTHVVGMLFHPKQEWQRVDSSTDPLPSTFIQLALLAALPAFCAYYAAVNIGWQLTGTERIFLTADSALPLALGMYAGLIVGVMMLARLAQWMGETFGATPTFRQCMNLALYCSTPLMLAGLSAFYPQLWFIGLVGMAALAWSVQLLYSGVPTLMHIPEERGFIFASSLVTVGLVLLVTLLAATAMLWTSGLHPITTM